MSTQTYHTLAYLNVLFQSLQQAVLAWHNSDGPTVSFNGLPTKAFSSDLERKIEDFLDKTADDGCDVPLECKPVVMAIDSFFDAYDKFKRQCVEENPNTPPNGTAELWKAYESTNAALRSQPKLSPPAPIAKLCEMGVNHSQIAAIYGWRDEAGQPDTTKVAEEIEKPGMHYKPGKWVHPAIKDRQATIEAEWKNRRSTRKPVFVQPVAAELPGSIPSLNELVFLGAPPEQINKLYPAISIEDAEQLLKEAGTADDGKILHPASPEVAHHERMRQAEQQKQSEAISVL